MPHCQANLIYEVHASLEFLHVDEHIALPGYIAYYSTPTMESIVAILCSCLVSMLIGTCLREIKYTYIPDYKQVTLFELIVYTTEKSNHRAGEQH